MAPSATHQQHHTAIHTQAHSSIGQMWRSDRTRSPNLKNGVCIHTRYFMDVRTYNSNDDDDEKRQKMRMAEWKSKWMHIRYEGSINWLNGIITEYICRTLAVRRCSWISTFFFIWNLCTLHSPSFIEPSLGSVRFGCSVWGFRLEVRTNRCQISIHNILHYSGSLFCARFHSLRAAYHRVLCLLSLI